MKRALLPIIQARIAADKDGFIARLVRQVEILENGCAIWLGRVNKDGYPRMNFRLPDGDRKHVTVYVHHLFWVLRHGIEIPDGMQLDHTCFTPNCVHPWCTEAVTKRVNLERRRKPRGRGG